MSLVNLYAVECKTLSRSRDIPIKKSRWQPKRLRSEAEPRGLANIRRIPFLSKKVQRVNAMADHTLSWCKEDHLEGRGFLLENPARSYLWSFEEAIELSELPGVIDVLCHNCMFARGRRRKWTRWRTNLQGLVALERTCNDVKYCDRTKALHEAFTPNVPKRGDISFVTEEEAEYPEEMLESMQT